MRRILHRIGDDLADVDGDPAWLVDADADALSRLERRLQAEARMDEIDRERELLVQVADRLLKEHGATLRLLAGE